MAERAPAVPWLTAAANLVGRPFVLEPGSVHVRRNTGNAFAVVSCDETRFLVKVARRDTLAGDRLRSEADWYERYEGTSARALLPRYFGCVDTEFHRVVVLEYLAGCRTLRDRLLRGELNAGAAAAIVVQILDLFGTRPGAPAATTEIHLLMRARVDQRSDLLRFVLARNAGRLGVGIDDPLRVNGGVPTSIASAIATIGGIADRLASVPLGFEGFAHGDFHLENILVAESGRFHLVDPNDVASRLPLYDLAKCFMSVRGCYDLIHCGRYRLQRIRNDWTLRFPARETAIWNAVARRIARCMTSRWLAADVDAITAAVRRAAVVHWLCLLPHHAGAPQRFRAIAARMIETLHHDGSV